MFRFMFALALALGLCSLTTAQPQAPFPNPPVTFGLDALTPNEFIVYWTSETGQAGVTWTRKGEEGVYAIGAWIQKAQGGAWVDVPDRWVIDYTGPTTHTLTAWVPGGVGSLGAGDYCVCVSCIRVSSGLVSQQTWKYFHVEEMP